MKNMKPKTLMAFGVCFVQFGLYAQSGTTSSGNDISGSGGQVSYSIGQVNYSNSSSANGSVNEGLQQPIEIYQYTGINDQFSDFSLDYYPNPSVDILNLEYEGVDEKLTIRITDMDGKLVRTLEIQQSPQQINIADLAKASYLLSVYNNDIKLTTYQFIKQ